jgi:hypothetical protein
VVCPRSITFTLAGNPGVTVHVVEDGGKLDFNLTAQGSTDLSGLFFDFTNSKLSTLTATETNGGGITQFLTGPAGSVINLMNGVNLNGRPVSGFDVGMEFGLAGIGSNHQNIQSESFVLSDAANNLSINDLHPVGETGTVGVRSLSNGQKLETVAPYAPTATPDTVTTLEDVPTVKIYASQLATDLNPGATLTISEIGTGAEGPQYGNVTIGSDSGGSYLIYTPTTLDYKVDGILTGNKDAFQVCVTDSFGGEVTSFVTVNATPVADTPTVAESIAKPQPGDPATLVRFNVTVTSGDFATIDQGSDYIKSLALALTGTKTSGITITDSLGLLSGNVITPPANQGQFTDQIIVSLPAGSNFSDTLSFTGTNSEFENTGSPATASTTVSQTITADTETTLEDVPITIPISHLVSASGMTISSVAINPTYGTVTIASDGQSLTYTPTTLDNVGAGPTLNQDVFQVDESNGAGNTAVTLVTVNATPVADPPPLTLTLLTPHVGDPATEMRYLVTVQAGDYGTINQGADFIQGLSLSLGGNVTSGVTITDTGGYLSGNTFNLPNNQSFTDEIDVITPSSLSPGTNLNDQLSVTAVNAEKEGFGSPATASATQAQSIAIDYSQQNTSVDFTTSGQNIWGPGNAFTFGYNQFLGISNNSDNHTHGSLSGLSQFNTGKIGGFVSPLGVKFGATAHGTLALKAGFQVDLNINGGSFDASLPFNLTLNDVYNKTTDTLQIGSTDSAGTGTFTSTGPGGNADLKAIFDMFASLGGSACAFGACTHGNVRVPSSGTLGGTKTLLNLNSSNLHVSIPLGNVATLNLTWPQVNTSGTGTMSISASGMAQGLGISVDLIAAILDAVFGTDPLKGTLFNVLGIKLTYDLLSADLKAGLDLGQQFDLTNSGITADLLVGTKQVDEGPLNFGGTNVIGNVSSTGLNPDGTIPLALKVSLNSPELQNLTNLVPTAGASLTVGAVNVSPGIFKGTLFKTGITIPLGTINVFHNTFPAAFAQQNVSGLTVS